MTRVALTVALITAASLSAAHACPPPQRTVMRVELLTPDGTDIPEDGGLIVRRTQGYDDGPGDLASPTYVVQTRDGIKLAVEVIALADGLELWTLPPGDRELQLVDPAGKIIRGFRQTRVRSRRAPAAPRIKRLAATPAIAMRGPGVPASSMRLDLAAPPPADTLLLLGDLISGPDAVPWLSLAASGTRYDRSTYAHKGCSPGPAPVSARAKLRFRYLSASGRLSSASRTITAAPMR